jgi:hypothetical protein
MTKVFSSVSRRLSVLSFIILCLAFSAHAQKSRDARLVSAQAGGVNYVSGSVSVRLKGETAWGELTTEQNLDSGDAVRTGAYGRVEVLLNPGSYLRVAENSEFELADSSLDNLRIKLLKGSAVIEATGYGDNGDGSFLMAVATPHTQVSIIRSGIYRFNVTASGATEVAVHKGRALVGAGQGTLLKGGKTARIVGANVEVAKLDKKDRDDLDVWSKERAGELAAANRKLSTRTLNPVLASLSFNDMWGNASSRYYRTGVWIFDARSGCYTFLPFYDSFSSPYGGFYGSRIYGFGNNNCYGCGRNRGGTTTTLGPSDGTNNFPGTGIAGPGPSSGPSGGPSPAPQPRDIQPPVRDITPTRTIESPRTLGPSVHQQREH